MRVYSDKYKGFKQNMSERYNDLFNMDSITPVDMNGRRVNLDANDPTNLEKTAEDIKEFYGLDES